MKSKRILLMGALTLGGVIFISGCANPVAKNDEPVQAKSTDVNQNKMQSVTGAPVGNGGGQHKNGELDNIETIVKAELTDAEKNGIIQMREEEKLARDVYTVLGEKWGQNVFINIKSSEQSHMDEVNQLIVRYELNDPIGSDDKVGVFTSSKLQKIYNDLIAQGNKSLVEALKVGATVEDLDIKDLDDLMENTDNEDIKYVYKNLKAGSERHLQSFVKNITNKGDSYVPQYISQSQYNEILATERQTGGKR